MGYRGEIKIYASKSFSIINGKVENLQCKPYWDANIPGKCLQKAYLWLYECLHTSACMVLYVDGK
jgi:hypothetical protein